MDYVYKCFSSAESPELICLRAQFKDVVKLMAYEQIWSLITLLGSPRGWLIGAAILLLAYTALRHRFRSEGRLFFRRFLIILVPSLVLTLALTYSLKLVTGIERGCIPCTENPIDCNPHCPEDSSFPSGHSATAFAAFTSLFLAGPKRSSLSVFIIPILVGASRVVLAVHTPIDVLAGSAMGLFISLAAARALSSKRLLDTNI